MDFEKCGRVTDVFNSGKGFAFVTFARAEDANAAIEEMDGEMLNAQWSEDFCQGSKAKKN